MMWAPTVSIRDGVRREADGRGLRVDAHAGRSANNAEKSALQNVVADVNEFFSSGLDKLDAFGVAREQVILDVGIGFGKTPEHNLQLLGALGDFTRWNRPLMVGASRKSFIWQIDGADRSVGAAGRLPGLRMLGAGGGRSDFSRARRGGDTPGLAHDGSNLGRKDRMIEILNVIWKPAIEILILAVGIYYILRFVWGTRGFSILTGFLVVLLTLALITSFF
jgi:hypothetical protein